MEYKKLHKNEWNANCLSGSTKSNTAYFLQVVQNCVYPNYIYKNIDCGKKNKNNK